MSVSDANIVPDTHSVNKAIELAKNNPELLEMICILIPESEISIKIELERYAGYLKSTGEGSHNIWAGNEPKILNSSVRQQLFLSETLSATLDGRPEEIMMQYSLDKDSNFLRGYLRDHQYLDLNDQNDQSINALLDQNLQSWLVSNGWYNKNGVIHDTANDGARVTPEKFNSAIHDQKKGLVRLMNEHKLNAGIQLSVKDINELATSTLGTG